VAVIKIEAKDLPILPLGDSDVLEVGEWVLAIGNPFGLSHTLTAGIVSAKGRSSIGITDYEDFIQTDAAINPGNSGGPLINLEGRAVGINTAIFSQTGGYMGIGFAIPINMAKGIRDQLIKHGSVTRGYLGIRIQDITPELAKTFGLKTTKGVLISEVTKGSPAEKAGMARGDVIVEFNEHPVEKVGSFRNEVALVSPGTQVNITVIRHGKQQSIALKIGKLPAGKQAVSTQSDILDKLGLTVQTLTRDMAEQLGYQGETGVVVTQVVSGSVAALAGIRSGTLILEVNRKHVHNIAEFDEALAQTPSKGEVLLLVKEEAGSHYVVLKYKE
jgi:serine protease Do